MMFKGFDIKSFFKLAAVASLFILTGCSAVDFGSGGSGGQTCFTDQDNYQRLCKVEGTNITGFCIITKITNDIREMLQNAAGNLFDGIKDGIALEILSPILTLAVMVYGVLILMGLVQMNGWDAFVRVFKFGLVTTVFTPTGWDFFEQYVATFFRDGADDIIQQTSLLMIDKLIAMFGNVPTSQEFLDNMKQAIDGYSYAKQTGAGGNAVNPFLPVDVVLGLIISPKTLAILQAASSEGTVGWGFAYVMIYGFGVLFFIMAIAKALWVYLLSLLATALLFGMFPFFILFILFQRTKGIFDGYIKLLATFMIQPIFLFMFISLFVSIIAASLQDIVTTLNVCSTCTGDSSSGDLTCSWQFSMDVGGDQTFCRSDPSGMVGYGATATPCEQLSEDISKMFPNLLIFFLMAYICWNFVDFVTTIARGLTGGMDISGAGSFLHGLFSQGMGKLQSQISSNMFPKK